MTALVDQLPTSSDAPRTQLKWADLMTKNVSADLRGYSRCGLSILLTIKLSGCLIVPFPTMVEPLPFPDEETSQIVPGITSRQKVIDLLGEPDFERPGSSLVLYGANRRVAGVFVVAPQQALGVGPIKTGHLLVLVYDENEMVLEADIFRKALFRNNSEVCIASGVCQSTDLSTELLD